jgi:sporulation protein YqfC
MQGGGMMLRKLADRARDELYLSPQIHFDCDRELLIENCRRIEEYNDVFVRLLSGRLYVQIWGSGLKAYDYNTQGLVVRGKISQVEFIERSGRESEEPASGLHTDKR